MPTPELVEFAQKEIAKLPRQPRDSEEEYYWRCSVVTAALKAHEEYLAEQGLVVPRVERQTSFRKCALCESPAMFSDSKGRRFTCDEHRGL